MGTGRAGRLGTQSAEAAAARGVYLVVHAVERRVHAQRGDGEAGKLGRLADGGPRVGVEVFRLLDEEAALPEVLDEVAQVLGVQAVVEEHRDDSRLVGALRRAREVAVEAPRERGVRELAGTAAALHLEVAAAAAASAAAGEAAVDGAAGRLELAAVAQPAEEAAAAARWTCSFIPMLYAE